MYCSRFASTPYLEAYLQDGRITGPGETIRDMISRVVATLAAADSHFDPAAPDSFAQSLGEALDDRRVVFSTPVMTNAGRHVSRPLAACAVPPADLRGDLAMVKAIVDDYHRAGMGPGSPWTASTTRSPCCATSTRSQSTGRPAAVRTGPSGTWRSSRCPTRERWSSSAARPALMPAARSGSSTSPCRSPTRK